MNKPKANMQIKLKSLVLITQIDVNYTGAYPLMPKVNRCLAVGTKMARQTREIQVQVMPKRYLALEHQLLVQLRPLGEPSKLPMSLAVQAALTKPQAH